ncbi:hypothetical protein ACRWUA_15510 [Escherichia coli]
MLQKNIPGKEADYYAVSGTDVTLSIDPLLKGLRERIENSIKYGPGPLSLAANDYIAECKAFFKNTPTDVWLKIDSALNQFAGKLISDNQTTVKEVKTLSTLGVIIFTALFCTVFGVVSYLMIPLLN